jgi:ATP-dependent DNA ligase
VKLPTLYKRTSSGKIEQWSIRVEVVDGGSACDPDSPHKIVTEHGHVGGKLQESSELVAEGKNLGKANATTAQEQAESQAKSEWNVKLTRKGYTEDISKAGRGENEGAGGIRPMLAQAFSKHGDKIEFPSYSQPKLDGIRCIAVVGEMDPVTKRPQVTLWSREQKPIVAVPHIADEVAMAYLPSGTVLDGELYNHDLKNDFEKIVSAVRKQGPVDGDTAKLIQYHIYDLPRFPGMGGFAFGDRTVKLGLMLPKGKSLKIVETKLIHDKDELLAYFDDCRSRGYEGCMARNVAPYEEGKRSYGLQKLKEFDEGEFPIVGVEEGVGKMAGLAIFVCLAGSGSVQEGLNTFRCKMEGSLEELRKYVDDPSLAVGKMLTVKYQGLTGKAKVPRFPVGKAIRDYE